MRSARVGFIRASVGAGGRTDAAVVRRRWIIPAPRGSRRASALGGLQRLPVARGARPADRDGALCRTHGLRGAAEGKLGERQVVPGVGGLRVDRRGTRERALRLLEL